MNKEEIKLKVLDPILKAGYKAYFVGGCVRDEILGKEPKDYDIATSAVPSQLHEVFDKFSNVSDNSEPYGVTMPIVDGEEVEIATFRNDITKGRHPKVRFTSSLEEDAMRRDFTMNALYEDIDGNIIDPTGQGIDDAKNHVVRFVGWYGDRLFEDPLRAFRLVRFMSNGFSSPLEILSIKIDYSECSKERVLKEVRKIFSGRDFMKDSVQRMFNVLHLNEYLGMDKIFADMRTCKQSPKWHSEGTVDIHTKLVMKETQKILNDGDFDEETRFIMMMAAFLHDIGKAPSGRKNGLKPNSDIPDTHDHDEVGAVLARRFAKSIGLTKVEQDIIYNLVLYHMKAHRLTEMKSRYKIFKLVTMPEFDMLVMLARADERGSIKTVEDEWGGIDDGLQTELVKECINAGGMPKPLVTGDDLINAGLKPDASFAFRLEKAHMLQIDNGITNKEQLLKQAVTFEPPRNIKNRIRKQRYKARKRNG